MKIFHVIPQLRGTAGRYVVDIAIAQAKHLGHEVCVCVSSDADEQIRSDSKLAAELFEKDIPVETLGDFFHRENGCLFQAAGTLRSLRQSVRQLTVVNAHTAMAAAIGRWAGPDGLVLTCHGWGIHRGAAVDLQDALCYQLCDRVLTFFDYWRHRLITEMAVEEPVKIRMGIALDRYQPLARQSGSVFRMVTISELTFHKGVDLIIGAMPRVWEKESLAELHIIGTGEDISQLQNQAKQVDPSGSRILFHGKLDFPYAALKEYDLFVLASRSDDFPIALMEAMLAGLPIVATAVGGIPELLGDSQSGKVVPAASTEELAEGIREMLDLGRHRLEELGRAGSRFIREYCSVERVLVHLDRIYVEALNRRGSRPA